MTLDDAMKLLDRFGFPLVVAAYFGYVFLKLGKLLVDAHVAHIAMVSNEVRTISSAQVDISENLRALAAQVNLLHDKAQ